MRALKSVKEAAGLPGISPWTVRSYIRDEKLKPVRLGRRVLVEEAELERLIASSKAPLSGASLQSCRSTVNLWSHPPKHNSSICQRVRVAFRSGTK
jgi:excisionase family DNA binding protein